jgi:hypothetical protein
VYIPARDGWAGLFASDEAADEHLYRDLTKSGACIQKSPAKKFLPPGKASMRTRSEKLPQICSELLITLFLYRNDCSRRDLPRPVNQLFAGVPTFTPSHMMKLQECRTKAVNLRWLLSDIGYSVPYIQPFVKQIVRDGRAGTHKDPTIAALTFQLLSRIFVSKDPLTCGQFEDFMEGVNLYADESHMFEDLMFFWLLRAAFANDRFIWTKPAIAAVCQTFDRRASLGADFYPLLVDFVRRVVGKGDAADCAEIIRIVRGQYEGRKLIVRVDSHHALVDLIHESVVALDQDALLILAFVSKLPNTQDILVPFITPIGEAFVNATNKHWPDLHVESGLRLHELPHVYHGRPIDAPAGSVVTPIPIALARKSNDLFARIPLALRQVIAQMERFLSVLNSIFLLPFLGVLDRTLCATKPPNFLRLLTVFLDLLWRIFRADDADLLFGHFCGPSVFDAECSVFGPLPVDGVVNALRGAVIEFFMEKAPGLILRFVYSARGFPFLVSETLGRVVFCDANGIPTLGTVEMITIAHNSSLALAALGASSEARMPCLQFLCKLLRDRRLMLAFLSTPFFITTFLSFLNEPDYRGLVLKCFAEALAGVPEGALLVQLEGSVSSLVAAVAKYPDLFKRVFEDLSVIVNCCPFMAPLFGPFLDFFFKRIDAGTFDAGLRFLLVIVAANKQFELTQKRWSVLTEFATEKDYGNLLNLASANRSVSPSRLYLINRPEFLPLVLKAIGGNKRLTNSFLSDLIRQAPLSDHNLRMLHFGNVDSLLLSARISGGTVVYRTTTFEIKATTSVALELICLIACSVTDHSIASTFTRTIELTRDEKMIKALERVASHRPFPNSFPIGTLQPFAQMTGIDSKGFKSAFTLSFWLRVDASVMNSTFAMVKLMSFTDQFGNSMLFCLLDRTLCLKFLTAASEVILMLPPKMPPNQWVHYILQFNNETDSNPTISMCTDYQRVPNVEFVPLSFVPGLLLVTFGGYLTDKDHVVEDHEETGQIAQILLYHRLLSEYELQSLYYAPESCAADAVISSFEFRSPESNVVINDVQFCYDPMREHLDLRRMMKIFVLTQNFRVLSIMSEIVHRTSDCELPSEFASLLFGIPRSFVLYRQLFEVATRIVDEKAKQVWFEDILINLDLWDYNDILFLRHWHEILINRFSDLFVQKSYFRYFLRRFDKLGFEQSLLLKRIAKLSFSMDDAESLFC